MMLDQNPPESRTVITIRVPRYNLVLPSRTFPAETLFRDALSAFAPEAVAAAGVDLLRTDVAFEDSTVRPSRSLSDEFGSPDDHSHIADADARGAAGRAALLSRSLLQLRLWPSAVVQVIIFGDRGEDQDDDDDADDDDTGGVNGSYDGGETEVAEQPQPRQKHQRTDHGDASPPPSWSSSPGGGGYSGGGTGTAASGSSSSSSSSSNSPAGAQQERLLSVTVKPLPRSLNSSGEQQGGGGADATTTTAMPVRLDGLRALDTVHLVKARAAAASVVRGDGALAPAATLTLVFNGRVLSDDSATLAAVGVASASSSSLSSSSSSSSSPSSSSPSPGGGPHGGRSVVIIGVQANKARPTQQPQQASGAADNNANDHADNGAAADAADAAPAPAPTASSSSSSSSSGGGGSGSGGGGVVRPRRADRSDLCRICLDGLDSGPLVTPCRCTGSIHFVHAACLRRWRAMQVAQGSGAGADACGLCGYRYRIRRTLWASFLLSERGAYAIAAAAVLGLVYAAAACRSLSWTFLLPPPARGALRRWAAAAFRWGGAPPELPVDVLVQLLVHDPTISEELVADGRALEHHLHRLADAFARDGGAAAYAATVPPGDDGSSFMGGGGGGGGAGEGGGGILGLLMQLDDLFPPLWPFWRPRLPPAILLGRRWVLLQQHCPPWLWGALQAHVDFLMGGLYLLGAVGFLDYALRELLSNLLPPLLLLWHENRPPGRRGGDDRHRHLFGDGDGAHGDGGGDDGGGRGGDGHPPPNHQQRPPPAPAPLPAWLRFARGVGEFTAGFARRAVAVVAYPWNGLRLPADLRGYFNPHFAMLVVWFSTVYQHSIADHHAGRNGGTFTRVVLAVGVAGVSRFAVLEHALPWGRHLAQRLGERMLEIHEDAD